MRRVELVVLDLDAATERCLQRTHISRRDGAPADRVDEAVQHLRRVEPDHVRQPRALVDGPRRLDAPQHLEFFAEPIVLDRRQGDKGRISAGLAHHIRRKRRARDIHHHPGPLADLDDLPCIGCVHP